MKLSDLKYEAQNIEKKDKKPKMALFQKIDNNYLNKSFKKILILLTELDTKKAIEHFTKFCNIVEKNSDNINYLKDLLTFKGLCIESESLTNSILYNLDNHIFDNKSNLSGYLCFIEIKNNHNFKLENRCFMCEISDINAFNHIKFYNAIIKKLIFSGHNSGSNCEFIKDKTGEYFEYEGSHSGKKCEFKGCNSGKNLIFSGIHSGKHCKFSGENTGQHIISTNNHVLIETDFSGKNSGQNIKHKKSHAGNNCTFSGEYSGQNIIYLENVSGNDCIFSGNHSGKNLTYHERHSGNNCKFEGKNSGQHNSYKNRNGNKCFFIEENSGKQNYYDDLSGQDCEFLGENSGHNMRYSNSSGKNCKFIGKNSGQNCVFEKSGEDCLFIGEDSGKNCEFKDHNSGINSRFTINSGWEKIKFDDKMFLINIEENEKIRGIHCTFAKKLVTKKKAERLGKL